MSPLALHFPLYRTSTDITITLADSKEGYIVVGLCVCVCVFVFVCVCQSKDFSLLIAVMIVIIASSIYTLSCSKNMEKRRLGTDLEVHKPCVQNVYYMYTTVSQASPKSVERTVEMAYSTTWVYIN